MLLKLDYILVSIGCRSKNNQNWGEYVNYLIWGFIVLAGLLLLTQLFFIVKDFLIPDIAVKEKANHCAEKDCAFYEVQKHPNSVQEEAVCHIAVVGFEGKYRGNPSCNKSIRYFGKSPAETYAIIKRRKREFMTSISSLAGYLALILSLYRILSGE